MNPQLIEEASRKVPNPQTLVNIVSQRVRQLSLSHRPMIEVGPSMSFGDIALTELIEGKLAFESGEGEKA